LTQAPFYPREAVKKGLEVWHFGLVFGAFEITVFIVSPLIGANLNRIGVKVARNLNRIEVKVASNLNCTEIKVANNLSVPYRHCGGRI
jgi:hypothetical protein